MSSSAAELPKWDVFLSFRGSDTRRNFVSFLYRALVERDIQTFQDDKVLECGKRISTELKHAIEESRVAIVVVSVNYAESAWCLDELVDILEHQNKKSITVIPIFYGVEPAQLRWQKGKVSEHFLKHEDREEYRDRVPSWKKALKKLASFRGFCSSPNEDDLDLIEKTAESVSQTLGTTGSNEISLEGIGKQMKAFNLDRIAKRLKAFDLIMDLNSDRKVKTVGIWVCEGRTSLAKFVYQQISHQFERHCFLGNVKMIAHSPHLWHLKEEFRRRIHGQHSSKPSLKCQKVLLVADYVNKREQLDALAKEYTNFGPGSVVIITSHDQELLLSADIQYVLGNRTAYCTENCQCRLL